MHVLTWLPLLACFIAPSSAGLIVSTLKPSSPAATPVQSPPAHPKLPSGASATSVSACLEQLDKSAATTTPRDVYRYATRGEVAHFALYSSFAMAAYYMDQVGAWTCPPCKKSALLDTQVVRVINNEESGLAGYVAVSPSLKLLVVAFRGTDNTPNVYSDVDSWQAPLFRLNSYTSNQNDGILLNFTLRDWDADKFAQVKVHHGFKRLYMLARNPVVNTMKKLVEQYPKHKIVVTGHSLGAALATVGAFDLARLYPSRSVHLVTYASPRVGNSQFARVFRATGNLKAYRYVFANDAVPHLPPASLGFLHVGREYWIKNPQLKDMLTLIKCRAMQDGAEDPRCSNSILPLPSKQMHSSVIGQDSS